MWGKIILFLIFIIIATLFGWVVWQNMPGEPSLYINSQNKKTKDIINYGDTPMFDTNMRFPTKDLTYYIEPTCSGRKLKMKEAFNTFQRKTGILTFKETDFATADILIGCSNNYIDLGENLYTAGEGGPSIIVNTSKFKIIQAGKISLYKESECKRPIVEMHELAHVLGFDHTKNPQSIMYPTADCEQEITNDMIRILQELYSIEPLPDLTIKEVKAITKGRYLDFNITVSNEGLQKTNNPIILTLIVNGEAFEDIDMETLEIGYSRTLTAENIRMPTRTVNTLQFEIDRKNLIKEIDETDNTLLLQ